MSAQPRPPLAPQCELHPPTAAPASRGLGPFGVISAEDHGAALLLVNSNKGYMLLRKWQQLGGTGVVSAGRALAAHVRLQPGVR